MPINSRTTTANPEACRLNKRDAVQFTVTVVNQPVLYELNVPSFGIGESWVPLGGAELGPGYWIFDVTDFAQYGAEKAQGIRFTAKVIATPGIVSVS